MVDWFITCVVRRMEGISTKMKKHLICYLMTMNFILINFSILSSLYMYILSA